MAGQPQIPGYLNFDVEELKVVSEEHEWAIPGYETLNIVDWGEEFTLQLKFTGEGWEWGNLERVRLIARVDFHINEMTTGNVVYDDHEDKELDGSGTYEVKHTVPKDTIRTSGIFNLSAEVTFRNQDGDPWYGVLGFVEGMKLQIHGNEDPF